MRATARCVEARTVFGGRVATTPVVTYTLVALNIVAYVLELASAKFVADFEMLGQLKTPFGQIIPGYGVAEGEWYRLITGAFLHVPLNQGTFGITHILFNMWALWVLGPQLEQVLGRLRYTVLYVLSALGGNVLLFLVDPGSPRWALRAPSSACSRRSSWSDAAWGWTPEASRS